MTALLYIYSISVIVGVIGGVYYYFNPPPELPWHD